MTKNPISKPTIRTLEKTMWKGEILKVVGGNEMATWEIESLLIKKFSTRGKQCIIEQTIRDYLNELVKDGKLTKCDMIIRGFKRTYYKVVRGVNGLKDGEVKGVNVEGVTDGS